MRGERRVAVLLLKSKSVVLEDDLTKVRIYIKVVPPNKRNN